MSAPEAAFTGDITLVFLELGTAVIVLALLARAAHRLGFSSIPFYLLAGLAFGNGGLAPLRFSESFVHVGGEIGVVLLLFMLGLEYTAEELSGNLRTGFRSGVLDLACNFPPGFAAGLLLGWSPTAALLLGGVTYISSSGLAAKLLAEFGRMNNPETGVVVSILVLEDLAMAIFLPLAGVLLIGQSPARAAVSVLIALAAAGGILFLALRYGRSLSRLLSHESEEVLVFSTLGLVLLVSGAAQLLHVSAAIGAFLVGMALSGPIAERARRLFRPLRDLFAALFFLFFGLQVDPSTLPPVLVAAMALGVVTAGTKIFVGWWGARRLGRSAGLRAGSVLVARGEFSIVIAGLGTAAGGGAELGALSAAYVLFLAVLGPVLARLAPSGEPGGKQTKEAKSPALRGPADGER